MVKMSVIDAQDLINEIVNHFLGDDWSIVDCVNGKQANAIILEEIKTKYPSGRFRRIPKQKRRAVTIDDKG